MVIGLSQQSVAVIVYSRCRDQEQQVLKRGNLCGEPVFVKGHLIVMLGSTGQSALVGG